MQASERRCAIFNCDRRRGSYCCSDCKECGKCKNPCRNHPNRCGQVAEPQRKEKMS